MPCKLVSEELKERAMKREYTIKQWLEVLPDPYRSKALANWDGTSSLYSSAEVALFEAFHWSETQEGSDYWGSLHSALRDATYGDLHWSFKCGGRVCVCAYPEVDEKLSESTSEQGIDGSTWGNWKEMPLFRIEGEFYSLDECPPEFKDKDILIRCKTREEYIGLAEMLERYDIKRTISTWKKGAGNWETYPHVCPATGIRYIYNDPRVDGHKTIECKDFLNKYNNEATKARVDSLQGGGRTQKRGVKSSIDNGKIQSTDGYSPNGIGVVESKAKVFNNRVKPTSISY